MATKKAAVKATKKQRKATSKDWFNYIAAVLKWTNANASTLDSGGNPTTPPPPPPGTPGKP